MAILIGGLTSPLGQAVAACLAAGRGRTDVADLAAAASPASSDGVILCGPLDPAASAELVPALLHALSGSARPLVFVSTAWIHGDTRGRLAGEAAPLRPPPSLAWLPAVERLLFDAVDRRVRTAVVRSAVTYGERLNPVALASTLGPPAPSLDNHWSFVHVDDLAELLVLAFESAPAGSLYLASSGLPVARIELAARGLLLAGVAAPPEDARVLDSRAGSTRAFRELGWSPSRPPVLSWLDSLAGPGA